MNTDFLKATGQLEIIVIDDTGKIKETVNVPNMIVSLGKNFIVSRMNTSPPSAMSYMALGINDTQTSLSMTTLVSELLVSGAKVRSALTTTVTDNSIKYSATFPSNVPSTAVIIKEAGIFNSNTNGVMLARTTFGAIQKNATDTIVINWTITIN